MSEKDKSVFVVATANNISELPPELVRKGRFDEIFFVDLPNASVRADILEIHLKNRKIDAKSVDLADLVRSSKGFSGAEIERTRPLSVVMREQIDSLRAWANGRTVPAD